MLIAAVASLALAQTPDARDLSLLSRQAADAAIAKFAEKKVAADQIGITVLRLDRSNKTWTAGSYHGDVAMYPASVVKLFHLAYAHRQMEDRKLRSTPALQRALTDMIVESSNDATALVVDSITGTTGGPELAPKELARHMDRRQSINRWYASLGYPKLNACQKTWNEAPYGRERQGYGPNFELRNSLSPDVCARLMAEIVLDKIVSPARCAEMKKLLARTTPAEGEADFQSRAFTGKVLPKGFRLHSKAGYTDTVRHDVAHVTTPDGREFVLAIFTKGQSNTPDLIPSMAEYLLKGLEALPKT
ncbi:MAG: serine hydrolase [Fimbriimonas sp.]